jgi:SAGA-associated factor 29
MILSVEVQCWSHAASSISRLSDIYADPATMDTIERVNRLISGIDDQLPTEGTVYKKLASGLRDIQSAAATEAE